VLLLLYSYFDPLVARSIWLEGISPGGLILYSQGIIVFQAQS
jgi:hypothetical protein